MKRIMIDIESLGTKPGAIILSIGAVVFDLHSLTGQEFYALVDPRDCQRLGLRADVDTIAWWMEQDVKARAEAFRPGTRRPLQKALLDLRAFVAGADEIWANSPNFDTSILEAAHEAAGLEVPWAHGVLRDLRTIRKWTKWTRKPAPAHHALIDAREQAMDLLDIEREYWRRMPAPVIPAVPSDARRLESLLKVEGGEA